MCIWQPTASGGARALWGWVPLPGAAPPLPEPQDTPLHPPGESSISALLAERGSQIRLGDILQHELVIKDPQLGRALRQEDDLSLGRTGGAVNQCKLLENSWGLFGVFLVLEGISCFSF